MKALKAFFIKSGETIVQTVRDYPKGYLIVLGVVFVWGLLT